MTSKLYTIWKGMRQRCRDKRQHYDNVDVCARWDDFKVFASDMGEPPPGHTLDRINPALGYYPENCRWADSNMQRLNQRITFATGHVRKHYNRWRFRYSIDGVEHYLSFDTEDEALAAQSDYVFEREMHRRLGLTLPMLRASAVQQPLRP